MHIFISYRRGDDRFAVGRLRDVLAATFGAENVFLDVLAVESGANFEQVIEQKITGSDVVLVAIGERWEASRQSDAEVDYVEFEVGSALAHGKRVIPVLLGSRPMPARQDLRGSLERLSAINAHRIRVDPDFQSDTGELIDLIGVPTPSSGRTSALRRRRTTSVITAGVLVLGVLALLWTRTTSTEIPSSSTAETTATSTSVTGTDGPTGPANGADPWADLYPITEASEVQLFASSLDELPEIAVQVEGYGVGRGEQSDTVRVFEFESDKAYVPPLFMDWAIGNNGCYGVWWIARWQSANADVTVHVELATSDVLFGMYTTQPEQPAAQAGYLAGSGCAVMALWFGEALNGSGANLVDVEYRIQVFDALPSDLAQPDCEPTTKRESVPLQLCDEGESVRLVQQALVDLGVADLAIDGRFLADTESAVKTFQLSRGLPVDGVVTTATWTALLPDIPVPAG